MKNWKAWLHAVPFVVYVAVGIVAYTKVSGAYAGGSVKNWKAWLHAVPFVVYVAVGIVAYTKVSGWLAVAASNRNRLLAETAATFRAVNDTNAALQQALARAHQSAAEATARAAKARSATDAILAVHPIKLAPAACQPYAAAVSSCQREASNLRTAVDTLTTALRAAQANLARNRATLEVGGKALEKARCHFPCISFHAVLGGGLDTEGHPRAGVFGGLTLF